MTKDPNYRRQREMVHDLLSAPNRDGLTRLQISRCLGIERGSICRRIAELQDQGRLWIIRKGLDPITHRRAEFLTCNREIAMSGPIIVPERTKEQTGNLFKQ